MRFYNSIISTEEPRNGVSSVILRASILLFFCFCTALYSQNYGAQFFGAFFYSSNQDEKTRNFYDPSAVYKIKKVTIFKKEVIVIPIKYYGTDSYFAEIKNYVDSLRSLNYTILYDGDSIAGYSSEWVHDDVDRKIRKCLCNQSSPYYQQTIKKYHNHLVHKRGMTLFEKKLIGVWEDDVSFNLPKDTLLQDLENTNGMVLLDKKDYKINLSRKYKCKKQVRQSDARVSKAKYILKQLKEIHDDKLLVILDDRTWYPFYVYGRKIFDLQLKEGLIYEYYPVHLFKKL